MTKEQVERGIVEKLGVNLTVTHVGNHRWETGKIETTFANTGLFTNLFSHVSVTVDTRPCVGTGMEDFDIFGVDVRWYHREGGENGADLSGFYQRSTSKYLSRDEANDVYWKQKDKV